MLALRVGCPWLLAFLMLAVTRPAPAAGGGKSLAPPGMLVRREAPDRPWVPVKLGEQVRPGDLLLALPMAILDLDKDLRMALVADMDGRTPFPAIESAVRFHENAKADVDFTLDRGRAILTSTRGKGESTIVIRFAVDQVWHVTLLEPKTRIAFEVYGRWPRGVPFAKDPKPDHVPAFDLVCLVLHGSARVRVDKEEFRLDAPPGKAFLHWDSVDGVEEPGPLPKLPDWAHDDGVKGKLGIRQRQARLDRFRKAVIGDSLSAAVGEFIASDDATYRRFGVYAAGASDDLPRLADTLFTPKHADVWEDGVVALRHWLGRAPGQDPKFHEYLLKERKLSAAQADTILQLLHSFGSAELAQPALFEMLIEYLKHDLTPVRILAHWHLTRLVPGGRSIPYDPLGNVEDRERAYQAWKKKIPDGKLPPEE